MESSDLKHRATIRHFTQSGSDSYGQPQRGYVELAEMCFLDLPRSRKIIMPDRSEIQVEAVLYLGRESAISVDDTVESVLDSDGNPLSSIRLRVAKVTRASDFGPIDHIEADLMKA